MQHIDIKLVATGDISTALSIAHTIAKALKVDNLYLTLQNGVNIAVSHESRLVDLMTIASLESKLKEKK